MAFDRAMSERVSQPHFHIIVKVGWAVFFSVAFVHRALRFRISLFCRLFEPFNGFASAASGSLCPQFVQKLFVLIINRFLSLFHFNNLFGKFVEKLVSIIVVAYIKSEPDRLLQPFFHLCVIVGWSIVFTIAFVHRSLRF